MAEHNLTPEQERHVESHAPYLKVFGVLLVLTILEYAYASFLGLGFVPLVVGLLGLSAIKAGLVGWYFMHLKFEGRWVAMMLVPVAFLAVALIVGLMPDVGFHPGGAMEDAVGSADP